MQPIQHQRGLSLLSWLIVLLVAGFFMLCAFKIVPLYAENRYISSGLKMLASNQQELESLSVSDIKTRMNKFYMINNVRAPGAQQIVVERGARNVVVKIDYEARVALFKNVDVVVSFRNHLDSSRIHDCCTPRDK